MNHEGNPEIVSLATAELWTASVLSGSWGLLPRALARGQEAENSIWGFNP